MSWLLNKKNPYPRLERWLIRLGIYQFEIRYKPGLENVVADMLSRLFDEDAVNANIEDEYFDILIAAIEPMTDEDQIDALTDHQYLESIVMLPSSAESNERTRRDQDRDHDINWIKKLIVNHREVKPKITEFGNAEQRVLYKQYEALRIIDGILYRRTENAHGISQIQLVLPKQAVNEVLDKIHCLVYSGHLVGRKTYKTMTERFYRPFLGKEIETYVRSCDTYQKVKSSDNPNRAELNIILPQRTNEMVVTDMAGPFKTTV